MQLRSRRVTTFGVVLTMILSLVAGSLALPAAAVARSGKAVASQEIAGQGRGCRKAHAGSETAGAKRCRRERVAPAPTASPDPSIAPEASATPEASEAPEASETPDESHDAEPTHEPVATHAPEPTHAVDEDDDCDDDRDEDVDDDDHIGHHSDRFSLTVASGGSHHDEDDSDDEDADEEDDDVPCASPTPPPNPQLTLVKSVIEDTFDTVGDVLHYEFEVTNSGDILLAGPVTIADSLTSDEACPDVATVGNFDANLDVGEVIVCTATYTITQDDIDLGNVDNTASASADGTVSNDSAVSVTATILTDLVLVKEATETEYSQTPGDVIHYEFTVTNNGNAVLAGPVTIDDDLTTDESCPDLTTIGDFDSDLDVGETIVCTASYTTTADDITAQKVTNHASASADSVTSNTDTAVVPIAPTIAMVIDATGSSNGKRQATVDAYNVVLQKWQARTQKAPFSLTFFNTKAYKQQYIDVPIADVPLLTLATYNSCCGSDIYDKVTRAINDLAGRHPVGKVHFVVFTDGVDNSSTTYTKASLKALIAQKKLDGWTFEFPGASLASIATVR